MTNKDDDIIADGIAFWYVPSKHAFDVGDVYGGKNDFTGLLVAIDNFQNPEEQEHKKRFNDGLTKEVLFLRERECTRKREESLILAVYHHRDKHFDFPMANQRRNDKEFVRRTWIKNMHEKTSLIVEYDNESKTLTGMHLRVCFQDLG